MEKRHGSLGPACGPTGSSELVHRICNVDMCEVFSPPRVGKEARKYGLEPGEAMGLTTGWDFNLRSHQEMLEQYIDDHKPLVVIGSPPCTPFSQLQTFRPDSRNKREKLAEGIKYMEFVFKLYEKQVEGGRVFIHENPAQATSWALPVIRQIMEEMGGRRGRG